MRKSSANVGGQPVRGMTNAPGPGGNKAPQPVMKRKRLPGSKSKGLVRPGR